MPGWSLRIRPILDVALARFEHEERLRHELAEVCDELRERKLIDRAKTMLLQRQQVSEERAYARLCQAAMNKGLRIIEVDQCLQDAADLLG